MKLAVIFNGQGGQYTGMGVDFLGGFKPARDVFATFERVIGESVSDWLEADDLLAQTRYSQPAILATSLAIFNSIQPQLPAITYMAGLSLGEYASLAAAGYLNMDQVAWLVNQRGLIMGQACRQLKETTDVAMAAAIRQPADQVEDLVSTLQEQEEAIYLANFNSSQQIILGGSKSALAAYSDLAKQKGSKKLLPLKVEGPFHTPLMSEACQPFAEALAQVDFQPGQVPVISNTLVQPHQLETVKETLVRHLVESVYWKQTMDYFADQGVSHIIQIGPGDTLVKMAKHEGYNFNYLLIDSVADVDKISSFIVKE